MQRPVAYVRLSELMQDEDGVGGKLDKKWPRGLDVMKASSKHVMST